LEVLFTLDGLISLLTLALMEIVLGIDNIVFISIIANRVHPKLQRRARLVGLTLALVVRIFLLLGINWIIGLKEPLFAIFEHEVSGRDIILFLGGMFLLANTTNEIHEKVSGDEDDHTKKGNQTTFWNVIFQIIMIDIVFSFDSILTAVGLADNVLIMILAVIIAMIFMLIFAKNVADFVNNHPTIKILALSFLLMIGSFLIVEAFHVHVSKAYIYYSMLFSLFVEFLNMKFRRKTKKTRVVRKLNESKQR
jgi:predicted tellurium resistance membrane protein TerC